MKIATIVGARPQFIKAAVVSRHLRERSGVREVLLHTGQHYDDNLSKVFFEDLGIPPPDHGLEIGSLDHGAQTGRMLEGIERILQSEKPGWVVVYGDTNSTLAGALAAAKLQIPVAHVESGLRSFDRRMPEEINRVLTDHVSEMLFVPTEGAVANLKNEGIEGDKVRLVGDVMYDAALYYCDRAEKLGRQPADYDLRRGGYVLATVHRAENTDQDARLRSIMDGLGLLARDVPVIVPLHPRTRAALARIGFELDSIANLRFTEPLNYLDMVNMERHAALIATDSGGVQKEAFFYQVPCATLRDRTEWTELVELGWNRLVPPTNAERIAAGLRAALADSRPPETDVAGMYGGGRAGGRIAEALTGSAP